MMAISMVEYELLKVLWRGGQRRIQDFSQGRAPNDGLALECY